MRLWSISPPYKTKYVNKKPRNIYYSGAFYFVSAHYRNPYIFKKLPGNSTKKPTEKNVTSTK